MGDADYFAPGQWNVECDQCDKKLKSDEAFHEWNNLVVCRECYDPRHSLDFVRGRHDKQSVLDARPDPEPIFVNDD